MGWEDELSELDKQEREYGLVNYTHGFNLTHGTGYASIFPAFSKSEKFLPSDAAKWRTKDDFFAAMKSLMESGNLVDLNNNYFVNNGQKASDADVVHMFEEMQRGNVMLVDNTTPEKRQIYHMKLTEPLFDKEMKEPNPSAAISYTPLPLSEKQYEMLKMSPEDAQKGLDSLGDPPKRASIFTRPFRSLYHMIKGDYMPFDEKVKAYNTKRDAYNGVIERGKELAAKFPAAGKETKAEEKPEVKENVEVSKETDVKGNEKVNEVKANDKLIKDEEQPSNHDIFFANSAVIQVMGKAVLQTMDDYVRKYDGTSPDNVAAGGKAIIDYIKNENNIEKPECERLIKTLALGNNAEFQKDSAKYSKFQKEYEALLANIGKTINEGQLADKDGDDVIKSDTVVEQAIEKYLPGVKKTNDIPTNTENKIQVNWQKINNESKLDDNLTGFLK